MKFARPFFWVPLTVAGLIAATGMGAAVVRSKTVVTFTRDIASIQTASAADSLESLGVAAKSEAQLLAAGGVTGKAASDGRYSSKIVETYLVSTVEPMSGKATVLRALRENEGVQLFAIGAQIPMIPGLRAGQGTTSLFPGQQPTHILMFEVGEGGVAICSAVSIAALVAHASHATSGYLELEMEDPHSRKRLGGTSGWATSTGTSPELLRVVAQPIFFVLRTRPSSLLLSRVGGSHFVAILVATALASGLAYFVLSRAQLARQALRKAAFDEAVAAGRYATNLNDMLGSVSEASGVMFFLLRPNARVDLFGPWSEIDELGSRSLPISEINRTVVGGDAVSKSILTALAARTSWVYTYRTAFEGATEMYQTAGAPVFAPGGAFIGLLGVRTNVSAVVRALDSSSKTDAIRMRQEHLIQALSESLTEDRHVISMSLASLAMSLAKSDAAGVAHWMEASSAAGDRIESALQAAVEEMHATLQDAQSDPGPAHKNLRPPFE